MASPAAVRELEGRWSLTVGAPFTGHDVSCAWVAPATLASGAPAVLKIGIPHFEAEPEIDGLRFCQLAATFDLGHSPGAIAP